ncbi:2-dehydropantoate 2-reductase [Pendulispora rubella]|uniref:2-dehydropantoate 2-reductase n=1 Tax=Pendulispora rubella TaxID=2741070 RepID=A0ABZ2L697_9BACT
MTSRIVVIGPGAIGLCVGAALMAGGHEVTFFARQPFSTLAVGRKGQVAQVVAARVVTALDQLRASDWVFSCVKAHQVASVAEALRAAIGPRTQLAILQNGVEHLENVSPFVPANTVCVPVMVDMPATRQRPGIAEWGPHARASVPAGPAGEAFCALLAGSFLASNIRDDWRSQAWRKLCVNAPAGAILALTGQPMGVFHRPGIADLARAILAECIAVGRAEGAVLEDGILATQMHDFMTADPEAGNSMYEDWRAGRETEWNARNGVILRKGAAHGVATPVSAIVVPLLAAQHTGAPR